MRFSLTADKELLAQLQALQITQSGDGERVSLSEVIVAAVGMLYQLDTMMEEGYSFAIIDPDGTSHILRKGKEDDDESERPDIP